MPFVLFGYAPRRGMGTRIERMRRIKTDFWWPDGHFFDINGLIRLRRTDTNASSIKQKTEIVSNYLLDHYKRPIGSTARRRRGKSVNIKKVAVRPPQKSVLIRVIRVIRVVR